MELQATLSLTSPLAWGIYIYCALALILAGGLLYVRKNILLVQHQRLQQELPPIHAQLLEGREQLIEINKRADQGVGQLTALFEVIDKALMPLLEARLIKWVLHKVDSEGKNSGLKAKLGGLALHQGIKVAFQRIDDLIQEQEAKT